MIQGLALVCFFAACFAAPSTLELVDIEYEIIETHLFDKVQGWAVYTAKFNEDVYYMRSDGTYAKWSTLPSALGFKWPSDPSKPSNENAEPSIDAYVAGMLECPASLRGRNPCNDDPSDDSPNVFMVGMRPVKNPIAGFYKEISQVFGDILLKYGGAFFSSWTFNLEAFPDEADEIVDDRTVVFAASLYEYEPINEDTGLPSGELCLHPNHIRAQDCTLKLLPPARLGEAFGMGGICDANGNCLNTPPSWEPSAPEFSVILNAPTSPYRLHVPTCTETSFGEGAAALKQDTVLADDFDPITNGRVDNPFQMIFDGMAVEARLIDRRIQDCIVLIHHLVEFGPVEITRNTHQCRRPFFNEADGTINQAWLTDPCCSPKAAFNQCCVPRELTYKMGQVTALKKFGDPSNDSFRVNECDHPKKTIAAIKRFNQELVNKENQCEPDPRWRKTNFWTNQLFGPIFTCLNTVFNKNCDSNQDCPSNQCFNGRCSIDFSHLSRDMIRCLVNELDTVTVNFWKAKWNIAGGVNSPAFIQKFKEEVEEDTCTGLTAFGAKYNQSTCEAARICNYDHSLTEAVCNQQTDKFCGFCFDFGGPNPLCWDLTSPAACLVWDDPNCVNPGNERIAKYGYACANTTATSREQCGGFWVDGYYNTQEKCDEGLCNAGGWGITRDECSQKEYCSANCPGCRASKIKSVCEVDIGYDNCTKFYLPELESYASWLGDPSEGFCAVAGVSRAKCINATSLNTQFRTCRGNADQNACEANNLFNRELGCEWSEYEECPNQGACEARGWCSDEDALPRRGACIRPFAVDFSGEANCEFDDDANEWQNAFVGCYSKDIEEPSDCPGEWLYPAANQQECLSKKTCLESSRFLGTGKDKEDCEACFGFYVSIFEWFTGTWRNAEAFDLHYRNRTYEQVNKWQKGFSFSENGMINLWNVLIKPLGAKIATMARDDMSCRFNPMVNAIKAIAKGCPVSPSRNPFAAQGPDVIDRKRLAEEQPYTASSHIERRQQVVERLGRYRQWEGIPTTINIAAVGLQFPGSVVPAQQGYVDIDLSSHSVNEYQALPCDVDDLNTFAPVNNKAGFVIGQAVSDGVLVEPKNGQNINGKFYACLTWRADVAVESCFTVADFATADPDDNNVLIPLAMNTTHTTNSDFSCGWFDGSEGTVFAIMRASDSSSATADSTCAPDYTNCPSPSDSGSGGSPTSSQSSSNSSGVDENSAVVDGGCFVATASYGSSSAESVHALRLFRDQVLMSNVAGRTFVSLYYAFAPAVADVVAQNAFLRAFVRLALHPLVALVN